MKVGIIASSHSLIEPKIVMHMQWVNNEHFHFRRSFFVELICVTRQPLLQASNAADNCAVGIGDGRF